LIFSTLNYSLSLAFCAVIKIEVWNFYVKKKEIDNENFITINKSVKKNESRIPKIRNKAV